MGHLINPTGFRLGYFNNWSDVWTASNSFLYSELLHNSLDCRKVLSFYFENFVTDRYSIMYSHFTLETYNIDSCVLKLYFYDGIVEQKIEHLAQHINKFNIRGLKSHKRVLRRFKLLKNRFFRVNFLNNWRYYDYVLARKLIYFFIYLLNLSRSFESKSSISFLADYFFDTFDQKWFCAVKTKPNITIHSFMKYYLKSMAIDGFDLDAEKNPLLHILDSKSDFSNFLFYLKKILYFWGRRQNLFRLLIFKRRISYIHKYKKYLSFLGKMDKLSIDFFSTFYRLYLINHRQAKFFKFTSSLVFPVINRVGLLNTKFEFFGLDNNAITASFLSRYLSRKLEMRFRVNELLGPIGKDLRLLIKNTPFLRGYKIQFVGRLTRRDRVRTSWSVGGSIPLSTVTAQIEHSFSLGILRNGICCLRVWLYRHKSFGNYNYNYKYSLSGFIE